MMAMDYGKPVVACNSGGPCETILDGKTGFLCLPLPQIFSEAMFKLIDDENLSRKLAASPKKKSQRAVFIRHFFRKAQRIFPFSC